MEVSFVRIIDGTVVVRLAGEVDMDSVALLRATIDSILDDPTTAQVMVDLRYVTFIDSVGLGALVGAQDAARQREIRLTVTNPAPFVTHQLHISGLYEHLVAPAW